jgi:enoyl-CoA hydratase/carnithine racemase
MTGQVLFSIEGPVATITLNRPEKYNAANPEMARAIIAATQACNRDDAVRCVIITGAGDKAFCAGSDIEALDDYATPWDFRNRADYCDAIHALTKPCIAAINGHALGGGLETALSCDIRIAAANARFAAPEIKLGWIGGGGMAAMLSHAVGASHAALMIMTGDPIDAVRALAWGLVSEVTEPAELMARARALALTIAARAPIAAETAKCNLRAAFSMSLDEAMARERDLQAICFATEDAREGRAAFREKRQPVFRRR